MHVIGSRISQEGTESKKKPAFAAIAKETCVVCQKTVYPMVLLCLKFASLSRNLNRALQERLSADDLGVFHKVVLLVLNLLLPK